ncbi:MAG: hypothetical protein K6T73_10610, partial [Candidatus Bathyarchaeota archaeon]|nr:hypothetical protein [Candidatus Bathyarchaeota archaeon]
AMLNQSITLPPELLTQIENFIETNKQLGFMTREESEYVEIPRDKYEKLGVAIKEAGTPYHSISDFVYKKVAEVLEKYEKWLKERGG